MIIEYVDGNLIAFLQNWNKTGNKRIYSAHGCNCFAAMGSGYAPQLARAFPLVKFADDQYHGTFEDDRARALHMLGTVCGVEISRNLTIFNAYTQYHPGPDLRLPQLAKAFQDINDRIECCAEMDNRESTLLIPKIGAGVAGGNWEEISKVIDDNTPNIGVIVFEYTPQPRQGISV